MSAITGKINSIHDSLSEAERKVADYILKYEEQVPFQSVYEIADSIRVSVPTVTRLTKKIGYSNFKDFKVELAKDTSSSVVGIYSAISENDSDGDLIRKVFLGNMRALEDTLKLLENDSFIKAAKAISSAKRVVFIGLGGSGSVAYDMALQFSHLDIQAEAYMDPIQIILQIKRLKKNEVAFGITHSGRTEIVLEAIKMALSNEAVTISLTNYINSPLKEASTFFFCTSFPENRVRSEALSSHIAQLCLMDALYLLTAKYKKKTWDVDDLNFLIEKSLRVKF